MTSQLIQPHAMHNHLNRPHNVAVDNEFYKFAVFNELNTQTKLNDYPFSSSQIACICKALYLNREGEKLTQFFETHELARQLCDQTHYFNNNNTLHSYDSAAIFCAYLFALYHQGNHEELFERIKFSKFESQYHGELQKLWYDAHYAEDQRKKTKKLGPVDKYRIRHKHPPPEAIWDGEKIIYAFKERQRKILLEYYRRNRYPKPEEKQEIARCTGLKMAQISNWFKNKRQRNKSMPPINDEMNNLLLDSDSLQLSTATFF